jgi:hypothetical protein
MAVNLSPVGGVAAQFFDNSGNVLTGGKLYTYAAGTTTPQVTYTTSAGNIAWSNPIILDAAGRVSGSGEIWLTDGLQYKFILQDSNNVLIATYDNVTGINSNFVNFTNSQEIQIATAGQTVFNLATMQYQPGTNSLTVFVDGVNQYGPGAQYAYFETDADTVTFTNGLHVGAEVKFTTSQLNTSGAIDAEQVSYDPPFANSVATNVENKLSQYVTVQDFGAVGDGVTDDTAAIQNAIDSLPPAGGTIIFEVGTYLVTSTIEIGDGTNGSISTKSGIVLIGKAGGVGAGEFGAPTGGTRILWGGATNTSTPVIRMNGPIHSCVMTQLVIDCDAKAGRGVELQHPYQCRFTDVQVERYTTRGWMLVSRTNVIVGVTQGAMDNTFINCHARDPATSAAETGLYMDGWDANNIGCSRNVFINCLWLIAGDSGTRAIYLGFVDNNQFIRCTTAWAGGTQLGVGIYAVGSTTTPGFPGENVFDGCSILGGYTVGSGTTGSNMFIPYMLSDGQPLTPIDGKTKALNIDGVLRGGWAGSACTLSGFADTTTALPADNTTRYFSFSGYNATNVTSTDNQVTLMPVGGRVCRLRVYCTVAPGTAGSGKVRTFTLFKNGVTTGFEVTFTDDQVGDRAVTSVTGITYNGGDRLELRVFGTNTPALTQAAWSIYYYPEEVI